LEPDQPVPPKKPTQDLVAGNPKSVIRQKIVVRWGLVLRHLKRAAATLTPNIPGMSWNLLALKYTDVIPYPGNDVLVNTLRITTTVSG
jgi:cytochrome c oxidase subunit IV